MNFGNGLHFTMRQLCILAAVPVLFSCKGKLKTTAGFDISEAPVQVVTDMFVVQTDKGDMKLRMEAALMESYRNDTTDYELFPNGIRAYAYNEEGLLETMIVARTARHLHPKKGVETWEATGDVVVKNLIKNEIMETDTLYWDKDKERIFTHSYVRLVSPDGFMQGYGMESDQRARSSVILNPFNSYGIVQNDSTAILTDSVNFIGPFQKN